MTPENQQVNVYESQDRFQIIDNEKELEEKINGNIDNLEDTITKNLEKNKDKFNKTKALSILNKIDNQVPGIDIDLAYDKEKDAYLFINEDKLISLNVPLDLYAIEEIGNILINTVNNNVQLQGNYHKRSITNDSHIPDIFEKEYINTDNEILLNGEKEYDKNSYYIEGSQNTDSQKKNIVENIYKFAMQLKGKEINDWKIDETVCKGGDITVECKDELGSDKLAYENQQKLIIENDEYLENKEIEFLESNEKLKNSVKENINKNLIKSSLKETLVEVKGDREKTLILLANFIKNGVKIDDDYGKVNIDIIKAYTHEDFVLTFDETYLKGREIGKDLNIGDKIEFRINKNIIYIESNNSSIGKILLKNINDSVIINNALK